MYVDARHPGDNHNAFLWDQSVINQKIQNDYENGQRNTKILGDDGCKLLVKPFLMTAFRNPSSLEERRYNEKHASARNVIERCFGVLKNSFRCIIGSRGLHYDPDKATQIINACCALRNMCIFYKCVELEKEREEMARDDMEQALKLEDAEEEDANSIKRAIAMNYVKFPNVFHLFV